MACPETDTTLRWLHGELAGDAPALHVAACPECAALLAEEEAVLRTVGPILPAAPPAPRRRWAARAAPWLALAAAAGLAFWFAAPAGGPEPVAPAPVRVVDTDPPPAPLPADPFDAALDDLDRDLSLLTLDLEIL